MSFISPILDHELLHRLGWVLIHSLWQGVLVGAMYAALGRTLRQRSAQSRYLAGCLALALLAVVPVLTFLFYLNTQPGMTYHTEVASFSAPHVALAPSSDVAAAHTTNALPAWVSSAAEQLSQITPWLALGWALGVGVFGARLARSLCWLRTLQTTASEPVQREWLGTLNRLRARFGITRPVRLVKSALVEVPTVVGWLRPVILLPASNILGLTPAQLEAILAHELAHVRRFDYLINAAQCLLETLMFYHPVVWWISSQVREEREHCCDDLVVAICGNKIAYARALAALEELRSEVPEFAFAANGGTLLNRIRRLLGASHEAGISATREAGALALIGAGLLLVLVGILLHLGMPRYQAAARIKLDSGEPSNRLAANASRYDPYFLQTQFEIIQSEPVLRRVIDELGLTTKWEGKYRGQFKNGDSLELLRPMLTIRAIRNTAFVEIKALSTDPAEARDIANGVVQAYREYSLEQRINPKRQELERLQMRAEEQQKKIDAAQERVDELFVKLHVQEGAGDGNTVPAADAETLRKLQAVRIEAQAQVMREETLLEGLKQLSPEALTQALPTAMPDTVLASLLEQTSFAEQRLILDQKEFGPQHPDVIKVTAQAEYLRQKTQRRVEGIMLGQKEKVSSLKKGLEKLVRDTELFRETELERLRASQPYFKAKRELQELQRTGETINSNLASALDQMSSSSGSVEIMDPATVPLRPVSPNRPRATACIFLGALLNILGLRMLRNKAHLTLHPAAAAA